MAYVATRGGERAIEQSERLYREALGPITPARVAEVRDAHGLQMCWQHRS